MSIPDSIQIGPYRFRVEATQSAIDRQRVESGRQNRVGQLDIRHALIHVDPTLQPDVLADTLLHEVLHGVWAAVGLPEEKLEAEQVVGALTPLLLDTLRRNPALVDYLLERGT